MHNFRVSINTNLQTEENENDLTEKFAWTYTPRYSNNKKNPFRLSTFNLRDLEEQQKNNLKSNSKSLSPVNKKRSTAFARITDPRLAISKSRFMKSKAKLKEEVSKYKKSEEELKSFKLEKVKIIKKLEEDKFIKISKSVDKANLMKSNFVHKRLRELPEKERQIKRYERKIENYEKDIEEYQNIHEKLKNEIKNIDSIIDDLEKQTDSSKDESQSIKNYLPTLDLEIKELEKLIDTTKSQQHEINKKNCEIRAKTQSVEYTNLALKHDINNIEDEIQKRMQELFILREECRESQNRQVLTILTENDQILKDMEILISCSDPPLENSESSDLTTCSTHGNEASNSNCCQTDFEKEIPQNKQENKMSKRWYNPINWFWK
ncbi:unnamed protein product [Blepharisma stoltei]|uniref:Uncharacterized protein n=1 Tax=Blepharisma stoltei TaxID=1481888 RepID=A0AAU9JQ62_9CILI|nr:unnamed protein product [Blepharisma stoltei]